MPHQTPLQHALAAALGLDDNVAAVAAAHEGSVTPGAPFGGNDRFPAEFASGGVKGAKAVADGLGVRLDADYHLSDAQIEATVVERLTQDQSLPRNGVNATVDRGCVTLAGEVDWHYQREAMEQRVRPLPGVLRVSNQITVRAGISAASAAVMNSVHGVWFFEPKTAAAGELPAPARAT